MQLTYTPTFEEYRAANLVWQRHGRGRPPWQAALTTPVGYAIAAALLLAAILALLVGRENKAAFIALTGLAAATACLPLTHRRTLRRLYRLQKLDSTAVTMHIAGDGIQVERTDGSASTRYQWQGFRGYAATADLFVLFPDLLSFLVIPRRAVDPAQDSEVLSLLSSHLKRFGP